MRLGVFGGTFNPIHYGHLRAAEEVRERLSLDKVFFVPAGNPPLKHADIADFRHRLQMTRSAVASHEGFEVLDIEGQRPEKSYPVDTAEELSRMYPQDEVSFIIGVDAFCDIPHWREPDRLVSMIDFIIISRPGHTFLELESSPYIDIERERLLQLDSEDGGAYSLVVESRLKGGRSASMLNITPLGISATAVRALVSSGGSVRYLLPEIVESYIMTNGLFAG